jgi:acetyl esterase/lipase
MKAVLIKTIGLLLMLVLITGHQTKSQVLLEKEIKIWKGHINEQTRGAFVKMFVFQPEPDKSNGSSVIICPGGSYCYIGREHEGFQVAKWLNSLGFTAFVLKYRVGLAGYSHPAAIQDLQRAIEIVRENATQWGLNPHAIGTMGFSAGGHLAATAAIYYDENFMKPFGIEPKVSLRPDFLVMVYPVVSMHDSIVHPKSKLYLLGKNPSKELEDKLSLENHIRQDMPPVFIAHARYDSIVDYRNSLCFVKQMKAKNQSVKYVQFNCAGHGFGINPALNPVASQWTKECEKWFVEIGQSLNAITLNKTMSQSDNNDVNPGN